MSFFFTCLPAGRMVYSRFASLFVAACKEERPMRQLLLGAMAVVVCVPLASAKDKPKKPVLNKEAPEIQGVDIDGKKFKLSDYRGKVVVLDFWGNW
jgi:hypothetical protein